MGKALGKQGDKILRALRGMQQQLDLYNELLETHPLTAEPVLERAKQYNYCREQAKQARWELIVHRQAIGFIVNNHKFVSDKYPISPALPETQEDVHKLESEENQEGKTTQPKIMRDQLDWWQRVGRWR